MRIISEVVRFGSVIKKLLKLDINLLTTAVPMIVPSSGSIGNNGALTLTTALSVTYSTGAYMYFPASAISAGSAAGFYLVVMSSTTVGTIYNNTHSGDGTPSIPSNPSAFVTTGPGAYTQSTSEITMLSVTVPGGTMGVHGALVIDTLCECNNTAGNKVRRLKFGGTVIQAPTLSSTNITNRTLVTIVNKGSASAQVGHSSSAMGSITTSPTLAAIDTGSDVVLSLTLQLSVATDWALISMTTAQLWRS